MADLEMALQLRYSKSGRALSYSPTQVAATLTGTGMADGVVSIGTGAGGTALPLGSVATPGVCVIANLDATNYVTLGYDDSGFVAVMKILPGGFVVVHLDGAIAAPYLKADTDACLVSYTIAAQ